MILSFGMRAYGCCRIGRVNVTHVSHQTPIETGEIAVDTSNIVYGLGNSPKAASRTAAGQQAANAATRSGLGRVGGIADGVAAQRASKPLRPLGPRKHAGWD